MAAAMPMPTSQRPSRTWPGVGLRRSQPKSCGALASCSGPAGGSRTACRSPDRPSARCGCAARWDRGPASRPARPWRILEAQHARGLARRAHRAGARQVELHQPVAGQPVRRGVEAARRSSRRARRSRRRGRSGWWSSSTKAVSLPSLLGAQPHPLHGRRAVDGAVHHLLAGDRPPSPAGRARGRARAASVRSS